ncbi:Crp/Fnr family transcriptional regulator [Halomonadaceae bacterium KBTZ08]
MTSCDAIKLADVTHARLAEPLLCPRLEHCSIHRHPFFQDLSDQDLASLCQRSRLHDLGPGDMVCREGDEAERFFIVLSGSVKLFRVTDQGSERVLGSAGTDEVLAEVPACSPDGCYPWYAQCLEATRVRSFSGALLRDMVAGRSDYMMNVMRYVAAAMSQTVEDRTILGAQNARERLVQYLLSLIPDGERRNSGLVLELPLPKGLLASQLAMQPETLSRVLRELRERGLVQVSQREVTILDRSGLQEFMG